MVKNLIEWLWILSISLLYRVVKVKYAIFLTLLYDVFSHKRSFCYWYILFHSKQHCQWLYKFPHYHDSIVLTSWPCLFADGTSVEFNSYQGDLRSGSYISMDTENLDMNNLEISFEFRALSRDSPLLYIAGEDHFVVLELISNITTGRMYFQIKLIRGKRTYTYTMSEPTRVWSKSEIQFSHIRMY